MIYLIYLAVIIYVFGVGVAAGLLWSVEDALLADMNYEGHTTEYQEAVNNYSALFGSDNIVPTVCYYVLTSWFGVWQQRLTDDESSEV